MNNKKNVLLIVLAVGVVAMTVAFAALSTNLRISGTASVPSTSWNIHFQNWALDTASTVTEGGITHQNTAEYPSISQLSQTLSPNITKVENLNVTLYQPGDYAKYTFQIINEGSIDASLDTFTHNLTCATGNDCSHLSYTIECKDSNENNVLTTHSTLPKSGGIAYCTLQVKYLDQTNQNSGNAQMNQTYTQAAAHATLDATWIYIQKVDSQANSGSGSGSQEQEEPVTPSNPYETTFDGNYTYYGFGSEDFGDSDNGWITYIRNDGTKNELCGDFQDGGVCLTSPYYNSDYSSAGNYASDFEDCTENEDSYDSSNTCLKGYAKAKADEMLSNGAPLCEITDNHSRLYCNFTSDTDSGYCLIDSNGYVNCNGYYGTSYLYCDVYTDGSYSCYE